MSIRLVRPVIILRMAALAGAGLMLLLNQTPRAEAQANNNFCEGGETPDLIVGDVGGAGRYVDLHRWGTVGGITAYSFAATACNVGTCWAEWTGNNTKHPVIGQNLFRLKDGRFEQLGQSWLKHGFATENGTLCGLCNASDDQHLGVLCSDLYVGQQFVSPGLAPKSDVNPYTGTFAYPSTGTGQTGNAIFRRLQVQNADLNPALNPGALYFAEVQYISPDDAQVGNGGNNASHRRVLVVGSNPVFNLSLTGSTLAGQPAIMAWKSHDPSVTLTEGSLPNDGKIFVAVKVTYIGGGRWRYEYALQNLNSNKAPLAVSIPYPQGATITNLGFHDVDPHSGAVQVGTDWTGSIGSSSVSWKGPLGTDEGSPNVLRWGTLYNVRMEVNAAPGTHSLLLGFTQMPNRYLESLSVSTLTPSACDSDGVCDPGESCGSCSVDCALQGGGPGCCGNGACEAGESPGACFADCGAPEETETACGDGRDEDFDGDLDCLDTDCCASTACDGFDLDGDTRTSACDCDDSIATVWSTPSVIPILVLAPSANGGTGVYWQPPADVGGTQFTYDVIRSGTPTDFVSDAICLPTDYPTSTSVTDLESPLPENGFFYLVRAKNACPSGLGPLGESSSGVQTAGRTCP